MDLDIRTYGDSWNRFDVVMIDATFEFSSDNTIVCAADNLI